MTLLYGDDGGLTLQSGDGGLTLVSAEGVLTLLSAGGGLTLLSTSLRGGTSDEEKLSNSSASENIQ